MEYIQPYDDDHMVYDYETHRYYLTPKAVFDELGINLDIELNTQGDTNNSTIVQRVLRQSNNVVYNYLYQRSSNNGWQEMIMATCPSARSRLKEVLLMQVLYNLSSGFVALYSGINVAKNSVIDINALRGRAKVADEVETFGDWIIPKVGMCLLTAKIIPFKSCYTEWGY